MESMLSRFGGIAHAALRIVSGFMFACHGAQKLFGAFGGVPGMDIPRFSLVWFAAVIEIIGGTLVVIIGLAVIFDWLTFLYRTFANFVPRV